MKLIEKALEFEKRSMSRMTTSDRVLASREAKAIVLAINTIYKKTKDPKLMDIMKLVTIKKRKIDKRLKGFSLSSAV
ncbi:hypothetical protein [Hyunsoonleella pacifica]|uniref:Uncharacterized protein n=1 Tax=Hyunsoonleella pacifica TaxID=1080224 RepID=A0A4Q9FSF0_9FLAO|nr:hypothetical protein [Hyunsoonleella pacifica]TBN17786.1 hypothetical protein EYD46_05600 [Hyunsoonleella pacifica]GGD08963.1 hypothetical protein GCM10011368_08630 [Hyunsoonleella pacifica]